MSARVAEADRDAANAFRDATIIRLMNGEPGGWKDTPDDHLVQAFARHREQATAELVEALEAAIATEARLIDLLSSNGRPQLASHFSGCVDAHRAVLSRHTEPTDAELLDQVCRGMEEVSKPLTTVSSDAPENAGARAIEPSERGE